MDTVARAVCMAAGGDVITGHEGVGAIPELLRDYIEPESVGSAYRKVARLLQVQRAAQTTGEYLARLDLLRQ